MSGARHTEVVVVIATQESITISRVARDFFPLELGPSTPLLRVTVPVTRIRCQLAACRCILFNSQLITVSASSVRKLVARKGECGIRDKRNTISIIRRRPDFLKRLLSGVAEHNFHP